VDVVNVDVLGHIINLRNAARRSAAERGESSPNANGYQTGDEDSQLQIQQQLQLQLHVQLQFQLQLGPRNMLKAEIKFK